MYFKINPKCNWKPVQGPEDWCDMLRFSGSSQNPGSSVLDELQMSNSLLWKAGEETITIIHPAGGAAHLDASSVN